MADSRSGGFLTVVSETGTEDPISAMRSVLSAICGIPLGLVRATHIQKLGTRPPLDTDWCSVGIETIEQEGTEIVRGIKGSPDDPASGVSEVIAHQKITFSIFFYGHSAQKNALLLRDALALSQNLSMIEREGLTIIDVSQAAERNPDFAFNQWVDRYRMTVTAGRKQTRIFGVRDISGAAINLIPELQE